MRPALLCLLALSALPAAAQRTEPAPAPADTSVRPENWAEPITLEGVPNLHRLTDFLYRSEQPTALGFKNLEKLGIRTVINLRYFNDDEDEAKGTSLQLKRIKMLTWRAGDDHVIEVMRLLRQKENGPFLIHCQHGADRTGLMSAMYRMLEQNWSAQQALDELVGGGYGFHSMWKNIKSYVLSAEVPRLRAAVESIGD
jgi:protein tyrosine/serine phosphatase